MASTSTSPSSRQRILTASLELMRRHGYAATGIKAILEASRAPYGSLYHHFPGGKEEVGVETIRSGGLAYLALVESFFPPAVDVTEAIGTFFSAAAEVVESTDFMDACPIATVAGEIANTSEPMRVAASDAFASWMAAIERRLTEAGVPHNSARELSVQLFCLVEGAFLLARTQRSGEPIRIAGRAAVAAVIRSVGEVVAE